MHVTHHINGTDFVWDERKAATNSSKHDGVRFEQAATAFFDPLFRLVDASRNNDARDAIIGLDASGRLLFVVHIQIEDSFIRIISARKASNSERHDYEYF